VRLLPPCYFIVYTHSYCLSLLAVLPTSPGATKFAKDTAADI